MHVYVYIHNARESLALNLEIGKTNRHSTVIANNRDSALSFLVSPVADQLNFGQPYSCFVRKMADGRQLFLALQVHILQTYTHVCTVRTYTHECTVPTYTHVCTVHTYTHVCTVCTHELTTSCSVVSLK